MPTQAPAITTHHNPREMSFGDHLEELRWRLILALIGPVITCLIAMPFGWQLVRLLLQPLADILSLLGLPPQAYAFGVPTGFAVWVKVSAAAGLIVAFPWVVYQLWKFIESGLYAHERRVVVLIAPFSAFMSIVAVTFLYYILLPICLAFLLWFTVTFPAPTVPQPGQGGFLQWLTGLTIASQGMHGPNMQAPKITDDGKKGNWAHIPILKYDPKKPFNGEIWLKVPQRELRVYFAGHTYRYMPFHAKSLIQPMMNVNQYISFVTWLAIGVLIAFQTPVVMLVLGWTGLVDPRWLAKYRKYCLFVCAILGAVFTPPDPVSMMTLMLPLYGLFELGLILMRLVYRAPNV